MLKDELAEQRTLAGTQEKEESLRLLEEGAGSLGGLQGFCEVMQGYLTFKIIFAIKATT